MDFVLTRHAMQRALEMELDGEEIRLAYECPEEVWRDPKYRTQMRRRGRVTLSIAIEDKPIVLTILWATAELWVRSYSELPQAEGRDQRLLNAPAPAWDPGRRRRPAPHKEATPAFRRGPHHGRHNQ